MSTQIEPQKKTPPKRDEVRSEKGTPTWEIAQLYPLQGHWTEGEYLSLDTNHLIEFRDGHLEFLPMPDMFHQTLMAFVYEALRQYQSETDLAGKVLPAPLRIRTTPRQIREPDVVFLNPDRIVDLRTPPNGADLVAEIVSPGDEARKRDLETKRAEYAQAGIQEYWIVDPENETVTVLALENDTYKEHGVFKKGESAESVLLDGFTLEVVALFAEGETGEKKS